MTSHSPSATIESNSGLRNFMSDLITPIPRTPQLDESIHETTTPAPPATISYFNNIAVKLSSSYCAVKSGYMSSVWVSQGSVRSAGPPESLVDTFNATPVAGDQQYRAAALWTQQSAKKCSQQIIVDI
ncbi:hypothetical protein HDU77_003433 [Chytriomyces hyalinus]|nr:hypothetical protein HDU77_003433 [Chytriomyces hyalinus]